MQTLNLIEVPSAIFIATAFLTRRSGFFAAIALFGLAILPSTQAVTPTPDGGYPNVNTAEGTNALFSLDTSMPTIVTTIPQLADTHCTLFTGPTTIQHAVLSL